MNYGTLVLELMGLRGKQLRDEIIQQIYRMSRKSIGSREEGEQDQSVFARHLSGYLAAIEKANLREDIYVEVLHITKMYKEDLPAWRSLHEKAFAVLNSTYGDEKASRLLECLR